MTKAEVQERFSGILTIRQVCEEYPPLNPNTMRGMRHRGEGPASFTINGRVVYRRSEIERWLTEQEKATTRGGSPEVA